MHTLRNRIFFFGAALAAGLSSLALHRYMMDSCIDEKGLLLSPNLPGTILWVVGIAFAVALALLLRGIGGDGSYADNFPRCLLSGGLMVVAGGLLSCMYPQLELSGSAPLPAVTGMPLLVQQAATMALRFLPRAAAVSMAILGLLRTIGKRPWPILSGAVCLFYMLMLVNNYRLWSADPQLHEYAYQFLAGVLLMLCSFHRTCCDAGIIQRRKLIATGLMAAVCCMASLSGQFQWMFYLASALWALGCLCNVAVLPPDPEPEDEGEKSPAEAETEE